MLGFPVFLCGPGSQNFAIGSVLSLHARRWPRLCRRRIIDEWCGAKQSVGGKAQEVCAPLIATVELRLALKGADDEFIQSHNSSEALLEPGKIYDRADWYGYHRRRSRRPHHELLSQSSWARACDSRTGPSG